MKAIPETEVTEAASVATGPLEVDMEPTSANSAQRRSRGNARTASTSIAGLAVAVALAAILGGCAAKAPVAPVTPVVSQTAPSACDDSPGFCVVPAGNGTYEVNGLVACNYANGVFSACSLNSGATLDDFVNSVTTGVGVDQ